MVLEELEFERVPDGGLQVTCRAVGHPAVSVNLNLETSSDSYVLNLHGDTFESVVINTYTFRECDSTIRYQCTAMTDSGQASVSSSLSPEGFCVCMSVCAPLLSWVLNDEREPLCPT